jgi:hypothetical protein
VTVTSNSDCYRVTSKDLCIWYNYYRRRQYDDFNQYAFLKYLKELQRKFRKLLLFLDRAAQHRSSIMNRQNLEENKDVIRVEYLPKGAQPHLIRYFLVRTFVSPLIFLTSIEISFINVQAAQYFWVLILPAGIITYMKHIPHLRRL